ncbi:hypothetical protein KY358_03715 [Candidatus Woesearchaeota archaeon]|nr:hypothetical protein [Candidatus Woesearchaeota archaeon]
MAGYRINIINNYRDKDSSKAKLLYNYVNKIAGRRFKEKIDVKLVNHGEMSRYLKDNKHLNNYKANGYIAGGGTGHWYEKEKEFHVAKHKGVEYKHPVMKRANSVYDYLIKEKRAKVHGICEGAKAIAQTLEAYSVNSGKFNINKEKGLYHKYLIPAKHQRKLSGRIREAVKSKEKHQGTHYIMEFEKGNLSGTQYHPERRKRIEDEETIVRFLQKATGRKALPAETGSLEGKVKSPHAQGTTGYAPEEIISDIVKGKVRRKYKKKAKGKRLSRIFHILQKRPLCVLVSIISNIQKIVKYYLSICSQAAF